jgi:RNA polymerase sigma-70 factor (ECF subfamily)
MASELDRPAAEERFRAVFRHLGAVNAYARRRGSKDAEAIAAEVMTIAWRRLADVPRDDPRPWLYATARNLVFAEARRAMPLSASESPATSPAPELHEIDPVLWHALRSLSRLDQEALLLVAWEELTPSEAAKALGIKAAAFRVRLLRARRRLRPGLDDTATEDWRPAHAAQLDVERT